MNERHRHFNPRPPCGGRPNGDLALRYQREISIHAPRVGGDPLRQERVPDRDHISIHAPRVGGDASSVSFAVPLLLFQSTPPVWGATYGEVRL